MAASTFTAEVGATRSDYLPLCGDKSVYWAFFMVQCDRNTYYTLSRKILPKFYSFLTDEMASNRDIQNDDGSAFVACLYGFFWFILLLFLHSILDNNNISIWYSSKINHNSSSEWFVLFYDSKKKSQVKVVKYYNSIGMLRMLLYLLYWISL